MLKLQEKQKLMVFKNATDVGSIYYTASFDSTIKVDNKEKTIYCALPIKCSKENFERLEKIFRNGAKYSVISADAWLCAYEVKLDSRIVTKPAIFIQNIN